LDWVVWRADWRSETRVAAGRCQSVIVLCTLCHGALVGDIRSNSPFTSAKRPALPFTGPPALILPSSAARARSAFTPVMIPAVCRVLSSSIWLSCCTTAQRWFMSVCWPPEGRPFTIGMPFCCAPLPLYCEPFCEGDGDGGARGCMLDCMFCWPLEFESEERKE
jgi:hypothetical protein